MSSSKGNAPSETGLVSIYESKALPSDKPDLPVFTSMWTGSHGTPQGLVVNLDMSDAFLRNAPPLPIRSWEDALPIRSICALPSKANSHVFWAMQATSTRLFDHRPRKIIQVEIDTSSDTVSTQLIGELPVEYVASSIMSPDVACVLVHGKNSRVFKIRLFHRTSKHIEEYEWCAPASFHLGHGHIEPSLRLLFYIEEFEPYEVGQSVILTTRDENYRSRDTVADIRKVLPNGELEIDVFESEAKTTVLSSAVKLAKKGHKPLLVLRAHPVDRDKDVSRDLFVGIVPNMDHHSGGGGFNLLHVQPDPHRPDHIWLFLEYRGICNVFCVRRQKMVPFYGLTEDPAQAVARLREADQLRLAVSSEMLPPSTLARWGQATAPHFSFDIATASLFVDRSFRKDNNLDMVLSRYRLDIPFEEELETVRGALQSYVTHMIPLQQLILAYVWFDVSHARTISSVWKTSSK